MTSTPNLETSRELIVLTAAKTVANAALRWVSPFLPVLQAALGASTATLTTVMGVAELGGLTTMVTGRVLDRGRERSVFVAGLGAVVVSSLLALRGSVLFFALSFGVLVIGVANLTVAAHAWIGHRVPFSRRGRAIGIVEMSWAIALGAGAPVMALLIGRFGWRGPYVALVIAGCVAIGAVTWRVSDSPASGDTADRPKMVRSAYVPLGVSAAVAAAGMAVFVVSGVWLDEHHGVSLGGLGFVAAAIGMVELGSSSMVAAVSDRLGTLRSVTIGGLVLLAGLAMIASAQTSIVLAVSGLLVFLAGFEFAFVASLTLVTEAAPEARGKAIGIGNALGTVSRAIAAATSGLLYQYFGMRASVGLAALAATTALLLTRVRATV